MRIGGLASGMDIDAMVKNLMTAERVPLNKLNQQKQLLEWKRDSYRQVSTKLVSFHEKLNSLSMSTAISAKNATVTGAANVLTAKATGGASNSILDIKVESLATASQLISTGGTVASNTPASTKLSDLTTLPQTLKIGQSSAQGEYAEITLTGSESIQDLIDKINSNKAAGVTAVYDPGSGNMSLTSKKTGSQNIYVEGSLLTTEFGLNSANVTKGQEAKVIINGLSTTQSSNQFNISGVEITLTGITPAGQSTQIEVSQDIDSVVDSIKSFVDSYNETLAMLNQKTGEERFRKYLPLTKEQREGMKEDEIKLWETKAKSGMLKNDAILDKTISDMRAAMITEFNGTAGPINIMDAGITTGSFGERGKLYIDEDKLRKALETRPDDVISMFSAVDKGSKEATANDGIFSRMKKIEQAALQSLSEKAGTSRVSSDLSAAFLPKSQLGDQLSDFDKRISETERRLLMTENRYYKQFTAMETAMNRFNSTSSSLFSMLS